jgi:glycerophosphoryl diester phosphodiesterase
VPLRVAQPVVPPGDRPAGLTFPLVIGHRGAAASAPENTLAGLRRAKALGCAWVEFDVRLTRDGELVLFHDARLDRVCGAGGRVAGLSLAAIRRHDAGRRFAPAFAGERVPTLKEAIVLLGELGLGANIEIKAGRGGARETGAATAELVARAWPPSLPPPLISSFLPQALRAAAERAPGIARGILFRAVPRNWRQAVARLGCATINADHRRLTRSLVAAIRDFGYPVLAYTVNDAARARTLFDWGVNSVFSDVPDVILGAAAERGSCRLAAAVLNEEQSVW